MKNTAIKLTNISKKYILHHQKPTLVENIIRFGRKEEIWALKDINLEIKKGRKIGIIGKNGSGKTTLLKIIAGVTAPSEGTAQINGRVAALLNLEAGFHPELTGEENIYLNGMLLGMNRREVRKKFDQIVGFSGLGQFIDTPFYTYSSGMKLRLAFSVAMYSNPDILLRDDETILIGDREFQEKMEKKIQEFCRLGKTMIIVVHELGYLRKNAERAILLQNGKIRKTGPVNAVIAFYKKSS